jgi:hypothetical protein
MKRSAATQRQIPSRHHFDVFVPRPSSRRFVDAKQPREVVKTAFP